MPDTQLLHVPAVEFAQRTDPGRDPEKQVNEDAGDHRETRFGHLCVVCDGMGGHSGGREASNLALATILDAFEHAPSRPDLPPGVRGRELLEEAIVAANQRVHAMGAGEAVGGRPGSTVVAILIHDGGTEVAHVGDSRCYHLHGGQVFQITKDHSMVQKLVDAQVLTPAQAAAHPDANKITRALGMQHDVEVDLRLQPVAHAAGDVFVLCSDGLSDLVEPPDILRIAGSAPAAQAAGQLVELANARGGHDNITVQVVRVRESVAGPRADAPGPTQTQTMPQQGARTVLQVPAAAPSSPSSGSGPSPVTAFDDRPSVPPSRSDTRRSVSPAVIAALVLGGIGVCAVAVALYSEVIEHHKRAPVAPFALSALPPTSAAPSATVAPLTPEPVVVPAADGGPAPLPSLVPARPFRRPHGSGGTAGGGSEVFPRARGLLVPTPSLR